MALRIEVEPEVLRWARERAGISPEALLNRFPKYHEWESGETRPTFKQLQKFAKATHAPLGGLLLPEPMSEPFPIPDFRTMGGASVVEPSVNLRDTVYLCELRQDWYRERVRAQGRDPLPFVGCASLADGPDAIAATMRTALKLDLNDRTGLPNWTDGLRQFIKNVEGAGVLAMVSGVVRTDNRRKLDPREFRGFALVDDVAPLVFVNGADTKAAQMFTLAHEFAHLCLGRSALSNMEPISTPSNQVEAWCNEFAAELLVPIESLRNEYRIEAPLFSELKRLARNFKVSTLVILRRLYDLSALAPDQYRTAYGEELRRLRAYQSRSGGNFYATQVSRVGERFARALITSTLAGETLYRDAFHLLGFRTVSTFHRLADRLGVT